MRGRSATVLCSAFLLWFAVEPVLAAPPPWAPAHGWRRKNDPFYVGYAGRQWSSDYGILAGRCDTDAVLTAVGAAAGGVIGNRTASAEHRTVATVLGAVIGGIVGNAIGDEIDKGDRACVGHSLELARTGQKIRWTNPENDVSFTLVPTRDLPDRCREFRLSAKRAGKTVPADFTACASPGGEWRIA